LIPCRQILTSAIRSQPRHLGASCKWRNAKDPFLCGTRGKKFSQPFPLLTRECNDFESGKAKQKISRHGSWYFPNVLDLLRSSPFRILGSRQIFKRCLSQDLSQSEASSTPSKNWALRPILDLINRECARQRQRERNYIYIYIYYIYIYIRMYIYIIHVFNGIWYTAWCCIEAQIQIGPSPCDVGDSLWNTWMNQGP